jgi:hypothetical protein
LTNDAAKPDCIRPTGDDGSSYEGRFPGELIIIKINETLLARKQTHVKNANTGNHTLISRTQIKKNSIRVSFFKEK